MTPGQTAVTPLTSTTPNSEPTTGWPNTPLISFPGKTAPIVWLEEQLAFWLEELEEQTEAEIIWAWQHKDELGLSVEEEFPSALQPIVSAYFWALDRFHQSSSMAECVHSFIRPYLTEHRGMPKWLLALHRKF